MTTNDDIPKWKKKKPSSTSKSAAKAKHKHQYVSAVIFTEDDSKMHPGSVCKICGKVSEIQLFPTVREGMRVRIMTPEEIEKKYKHWPRYTMPTYFTAFAEPEK